MAGLENRQPEHQGGPPLGYEVQQGRLVQGQGAGGGSHPASLQAGAGLHQQAKAGIMGQHP
jgi:hypothetical protein